MVTVSFHSPVIPAQGVKLSVVADLMFPGENKQFLNKTSSLKGNPTFLKPTDELSGLFFVLCVFCIFWTGIRTILLALRVKKEDFIRLAHKPVSGSCC